MSAGNVQALITHSHDTGIEVGSGITGVLRRRLGLSQRKVGLHVGRSTPWVGSMEKQGRYLEGADLNRICTELRVPPRALTFAMYPTRLVGSPFTATTPVTPMEMLTGCATTLSGALGRLSEQLRFPTRLFPPTLDPSLTQEGPVGVANAVRALWGLGAQPIENMTRLLEEHGVFIAWHHQPGFVPAASYLSDALTPYPLIMVDPELSALDTRLVLAQQLGHVVMNSSASLEDRAATDLSATMFATQFLAPHEHVSLEGMSPSRSMRALHELGKEWGIDPAYLISRAAQTGQISERTRKTWAQLLHRERRNTVTILPDSGEREHPSLIASMIRVLQDAQWADSDIANVAGIFLPELRAYAAMLSEPEEVKAFPLRIA